MTNDEIIAEAAEIASETAELVKEMSTCGYSRSEHVVQATLLAVVVGGLGGFIGYKVAEKKLRTKFETLLDVEVEKAREFYMSYSDTSKSEESVVNETEIKTLHSLDELSKVQIDAGEAITIYRGEELEVEKDEETDRVTVHGVDMSSEFESADNGWDWDEQAELRGALEEGEPYIIHLEEYMRNEDGFDQVTLTYYAGDGVLADDHDKDIPYPDPIVGEENLERFGFGSGNEFVLFVRNDRLKSLFEISVADGKYAHEVLGLEHSDGGARAAQRRKELRRMRSDPE